MKALIVALMGCFIVVTTATATGIPTIMNYQGRLTDPSGDPVVDGSYSITFTIYDAISAGNSKWTEAHSSVNVTEGLFNVLLGSMNPIEDSVFNSPDRYLGIQVESDPEILPRTRLVSMPYSYYSLNADTADFAHSAAISDDGDWTIDGSDVYHLNGNVGIGTSSPAAKLHVLDTYDGGKYIVHFNKYGSGPGYIGLNRGTAGGRSYFSFDEAQFGIYTSNSTESAWYNLSISGNTGVLSTNASFGIGTTSPTFRLDVRTADALNDGFRVSAGPYNIISTQNGGVALKPYPSDWADPILIQNYGSGGVARTQIKSTSSMGENGRPNQDYPALLLQPGGGSVGIGTSSPLSNYILHVSGSTYSTDYYTAGVTLGNGSSWSYKKGNELRFITTYGYGLGPVKIAVRGNFANNDLDTQDAVYLSFQRQDAADYDNGKPFFFEIGQFGAAKFRLDHNGNVGIGTTSPTARLHVANSVGSRAIYASSNATTNVNPAIYGEALANGGVGVYGHTASRGVSGGSSVGVIGYGSSTGGSVGGATLGVLGRVKSYQDSPASVPVGVFGEAMHGTGVAWGVAGESHSTAAGAAGVKGTLKASGALGRAIWGEAPSTGWAGYFQGNVKVTGTISKAGGGFKIDHPLDPQNRYLNHSSVESPDMKNVYDGVISLDEKGTATVVLPGWFDTLNKDFRYQLTAIGAPAPNLHIAEEIAGNRFTIAGGEPDMKVSWMVTGIRHDPFAEANRIPVEEDKPSYESGKYLHPLAYGLELESGIDF